MRCNVPNKETRQQREIIARCHEANERMFEFCIINALLTLGEMGYGKKRMERFAEAYKAKADEMVDYYDEYIMDGMRKRLYDAYGLQIEWH